MRICRGITQKQAWETGRLNRIEEQGGPAAAGSSKKTAGGTIVARKRGSRQKLPGIPFDLPFRYKGSKRRKDHTDHFFPRICRSRAFFRHKALPDPLGLADSRLPRIPDTSGNHHSGPPGAGETTLQDTDRKRRRLH